MRPAARRRRARRRRTPVARITALVLATGRRVLSRPQLRLDGRGRGRRRSRSHFAGIGIPRSTLDRGLAITLERGKDVPLKGDCPSLIPDQSETCSYCGRGRRGMRVRLLMGAVAAALLAVPAANAGLLDPITKLVLPTCGSNSYPFQQFGDRHRVLPLLEQRLRERVERLVAERRCLRRLGQRAVVCERVGQSLAHAAGRARARRAPASASTCSIPSVRMFTRGSSGSHLQIQVIFRGSDRQHHRHPQLRRRERLGCWSPSDRVSSSLALPLLTSSAQIRITAGERHVAGRRRVRRSVDHRRLAERNTRGRDERTGNRPFVC